MYIQEIKKYLHTEYLDDSNNVNEIHGFKLLFYWKNSN